MNGPRKIIQYRRALLLVVALCATLLCLSPSGALASDDGPDSRMNNSIWLPGIRNKSDIEHGRAQEEIRLGPVEPGGPPPQLQPLLGTPVATRQVEPEVITGAGTITVTKRTISSQLAVEGTNQCHITKE